jgi:hypothetical protein
LTIYKAIGWRIQRLKMAKYSKFGCVILALDFRKISNTVRASTDVWRVGS